MPTIRRAWIAAALCALAALALGGAVVLADDPEVREERKVRIVTIDDEGNTHEHVFEMGPGDPRPFLGVILRGSHDDGLLVADVVEDSGAERAGLREGDRIVSVDGEPLAEPWELTVRIMQSKPGDQVELEILRDDEPMTLLAEIGEHEGPELLTAPHIDLGDLHEQLEHLDALEGLESLGELDLDLDMPHLRHFRFGFGDRPKLGVQLVQPTSELREHLGAPRDAGVLVGKVLPGTPAEVAGVRVGDVIVAVDGEQVEDAGDLIGALSDKDGRTIELELVRDRSTITLAVTIPEAEDEESYGPKVRFGQPSPPGAPPALRT